MKKIGWTTIISLSISFLLSPLVYALKSNASNVSDSTIASINHSVSLSLYSPQWRHVIHSPTLHIALNNTSSTLSTNPAYTFPSELPNTLPANPSQVSEPINTPEYVIIRANDQTTFSSVFAATVSFITIKEGSYFKKGDILLRLDCREQQADLDKAKAQQAQTIIAKKSAELLQSFGSISEAELIKAKTEGDMAKAEVDKLSATVDKCIIRAPYNGAVADVMVHNLETVKPGDPLLKIINTENLDLEMQVPSTWLAWLHVGSLFYVHISEINQTISATITRINPQIDSVSQTVKIAGMVAKGNSNLLPGMSGQAIFPENPENKSTH